MAGHCAKRLSLIRQYPAPSGKEVKHQAGILLHVSLFFFFLAAGVVTLQREGEVMRVGRCWAGWEKGGMEDGLLVVHGDDVLCVVLGPRSAV